MAAITTIDSVCQEPAQAPPDTRTVINRININRKRSPQRAPGNRGLLQRDRPLEHARKPTALTVNINRKSSYYAFTENHALNIIGMFTITNRASIEI
ncbi:hypothetical protein, partial [Hoeflea sp.]|uniref:hypothetical protein n=1 Tax=Hoeflea sp. TaxID=1940281 RepID=UPI0025C53595